MSEMASAGGGFGGRGGGRVNSAVRGAGLIGLAVIVGIVLLQVIDKGPSGSGTPASSNSGATPTTQGSTPSSQPGTTSGGPARPRAEVRVLVYNAGAMSGAAGDLTNKLRVLGYQLSPPTNTTPRTGTAVSCKQGFEKEAVQVQADIGPAATIEPFPNPGPPGSENVTCIVLVGR